VAARTSSFSFKGKGVEIPEIARQLHVANVLEGSVRRSGDQLRITAQLIRAAEGYHLWSETYDRKMDDIFKIQDEIAGEVVKELKVKLLGAAPKVRTTDPKAYALFLQARELGRQLNAEAFAKSDALYRQVLESRSALRAGVGRAGQELHQQDADRCAVQPGGVCPCPRSGGEGDGDRSGLRTGARKSRQHRGRRQRSRRRGATLPASACARSDQSRGAA
jgi:hypothetical protein